MYCQRLHHLKIHTILKSCGLSNHFKIKDILKTLKQTINERILLYNSRDTSTLVPNAKLMGKRRKHIIFLSKPPYIKVDWFQLIY